MLPLLKPPAKKTNVKKDIKLVDLPIFDENGEILDEDSWPRMQGIIDRNHHGVIIEDRNDMSHLNNLGSFGQCGVLVENKFVEIRSFQNQKLKEKKDWQSVKIVPFDFPRNDKGTKVENETKLCPLRDEQQNENVDHVNNFIGEKREENSNLAVKPKAVGVAPTSKWKDFKKRCPKEYDKLLVLSGGVTNTTYFLQLEEAFFLSYTLECLEIRDKNGLVISVSQCWKEFNSLKKDFPFYYAAYHYYRSKGWTVKPGQQYGGYYVLYKSSPTLYHSSYVVVISINGQNNELVSSWPSWMGCYRAIEAANKDLLICTVHGPVYEEGIPIDLTQYTINDTIVRRWVPSQNRTRYTNVVKSQFQ